jgi:hypothetical protein
MVAHRCEYPSSKAPGMVHVPMKGLVFRSGREIVLTIGVCKKERKRAFAL